MLASLLFHAKYRGLFQKSKEKNLSTNNAFFQIVISLRYSVVSLMKGIFFSNFVLNPCVVVLSLQAGPWPW